jgi:hypothetical protein
MSYSVEDLEISDGGQQKANGWGGGEGGGLPRSPQWVQSKALMGVTP